MQKLLKTLKKEIFPISLILILALARLMPHPPNFTPIVAVAIMSSCFFRNMYLSFAVIIVSMLLADVFIGFYNNMFFVYLSLLLISFIFSRIIKKIKLQNLFIFGFLGSVVFFLISNETIVNEMDSCIFCLSKDTDVSKRDRVSVVEINRC